MDIPNSIEDFHPHRDVLQRSVRPRHLSGTNGIQYVDAFDDPTENRVLHIEVRGATQLFVSPDLFGGVGKGLFGRLGDAPDHALQLLGSHIPALHDVELAAAAPALRVDLVPLTGGSQRTLDVDELRIDLSGNRVTRAAIAESRTRFRIPGIRICLLYTSDAADE